MIFIEHDGLPAEDISYSWSIGMAVESYYSISGVTKSERSRMLFASNAFKFFHFFFFLCDDLRLISRKAISIKMNQEIFSFVDFSIAFSKMNFYNSL